MCFGSLKHITIEHFEVETGVLSLCVRGGQIPLIYTTKISGKPSHPSENALLRHLYTEECFALYLHPKGRTGTPLVEMLCFGICAQWVMKVGPLW